MLDVLKRQGTTESRYRGVIEQYLSNNADIYSAEDDKFLYYAQNSEQNVKLFHIVKGKFDYCMEIADWEKFIDLMHQVNDDFFLTGEGKEFRECFLGNYLSKYSRRNEFIDDLRWVIHDAKDWLDD